MAKDKVEYSSFIKKASLTITNINEIPDYVKIAAYNIYNEIPNVPASVLLEGHQKATNEVEKTAYEVISAALAVDRGIVKDYGDNQDLAKHAGLASWLKPSNIAGAFKPSVKSVATNTGLAAGFAGLGALAPKDNSLQGQVKDLNQIN